MIEDVGGDWDGDGDALPFGGTVDSVEDMEMD